MKNIYAPKLSEFVFSLLFFLFSFYGFAQVGINTTAPTTMLDVNGALSLRESPVALSLSNGTNTNISLGSTPYSQYRITGPTGAFSIDGVTRVGAAADGQVVRLINTTDQLMTIVHNNGGALKILCPSETNLILAGRNSSVTLQYNKSLARWTVSGYAKTSRSNNNQSAIGTGYASWNNAAWGNINSLSRTFTPINSTIYVTFNIYGSCNTSGFNTTEGVFRVTINGVEVPQTRVSSGVLIFSSDYQVDLPNFPISVTPGTEITVAVQWYKNGNGGIYTDPSSEPLHKRYLSIID